MNSLISLLLFASASSGYADEYRERALAMIEKTVYGQEIKALRPAAPRAGQVVNMFAALKKSPETAGQQKAAPIEASAKGSHRPTGFSLTSMTRLEIVQHFGCITTDQFGGKGSGGDGDKMINAIRDSSGKADFPL
jgi:hypothetical protein